MKIVFLGTPDFAVPTLERLLATPHSVVGVVTQPDRPRGRGQRLSPPPVKQTALAHDLPVLQPTRLKDPGTVEALTAWAPDVGVVAAYGRFLPDWLLGLAPHGMLNVHASLLPRYRGAAPIHRAVMAGDRVTGITIIRLVKEMDAGPMLRRAELEIGPEDTSVEVERRLAVLGADTLVAALEDLVDGRARFEEQDHDAATLAPRIVRDDGLLDWSRPARSLVNQIRGLHPWPRAFTFRGDARLLVHRATAVARPTGTESAAVGTIVEAQGDHLVVAAGDRTAVALLDIQPEGKSVIPVRAYLAGRGVRPGDLLTDRRPS